MNGDKIIEQAMDSETGFTLVSTKLNAYLKFGLVLSLVSDQHLGLRITGYSKGD
jgi:hypothetical protein